MWSSTPKTFARPTASKDGQGAKLSKSNPQAVLADVEQSSLRFIVWSGSSCTVGYESFIKRHFLYLRSCGLDRSR